MNSWFGVDVGDSGEIPVMVVVMVSMVITAVMTWMVVMVVLVEMRVNGCEGNDDETRVS